MECEDLAASIGLLSDCEKVVPSEVVVDKDDEMLVLVFDDALGVGDEIHSLLREGVSADNISAKLSLWASALFEFVLPFIRKQRSGETLLKSAEEALLMEKIQMEQQRLGVDEMYWVGNKRYEEEQEEQEEDEDEDDKEVEEGKHGDANVREPGEDSNILIAANTSEYSTMSGGVPPSESFFWVYFISENVLSFIDVAPLSLVQSYMDDVSIGIPQGNAELAIVYAISPAQRCLFCIRTPPIAMSDASVYNSKGMVTSDQSLTYVKLPVTLLT
nr:coiled-coil domain-containing protein 97 [Tanacetum cinerariifolium]